MNKLAEVTNEFLNGHSMANFEELSKFYRSICDSRTSLGETEFEEYMRNVVTLCRANLDDELIVLGEGGGKRPPRFFLNCFFVKNCFLIFCC